MKKFAWFAVVIAIVFASVAYAGTAGIPGGPEQTFIKGDPGKDGKDGKNGRNGRTRVIRVTKTDQSYAEKRIAQLKVALREEMRACDRKGAQRIANELELLTSRCDGLENMSIDMRDDIDEMRDDIERMGIRLDDTRDIAIEGATRAEDAMDLGCALVIANGGRVNYTAPNNPATPDQPAAQAPGAPVAPEGQPGMNPTPATPGAETPAETPEASEASKDEEGGRKIASGWWIWPAIIGLVLAAIVVLIMGGLTAENVGYGLAVLFVAILIGWFFAPKVATDQPAPAPAPTTQAAPDPAPAPVAPATPQQVALAPAPAPAAPAVPPAPVASADERAADYGSETPVPSTG